MTEDFSIPEYMNRKLPILDTANPHVYLLTSMSDFSDWKTEWRNDIFARISENPQHVYIFLTKKPEKIHFQTDDERVNPKTLWVC